MSDLDFGPHVKCHWCKKMIPHRRALQYNDKQFCGITCKIKQEEMEDDALYHRVRGVVPYREH